MATASFVSVSTAYLTLRSHSTEAAGEENKIKIRKIARARHGEWQMGKIAVEEKRKHVSGDGEGGAADAGGEEEEKEQGEGKEERCLHACVRVAWNGGDFDSQSCALTFRRFPRPVSGPIHTFQLSSPCWSQDARGQEILWMWGVARQWRQLQSGQFLSALRKISLIFFFFFFVETCLFGHARTQQ